MSQVWFTLCNWSQWEREPLLNVFVRVPSNDWLVCNGPVAPPRAEKWLPSRACAFGLFICSILLHSSGYDVLLQFQTTTWISTYALFSVPHKEGKCTLKFSKKILIHSVCLSVCLSIHLSAFFPFLIVLTRILTRNKTLIFLHDKCSLLFLTSTLDLEMS